MSVRLVAHVRGMVQGVGFRYATVGKATTLGGITGYVRNVFDGSVEVVAEGEPGRLRQFQDWLGRGPAGAVVRNVEVSYEPATGQYLSFDVEY